jgi:uncharacterized protein
MAVSSLLTLIDDIATILDDVAILSKVAAKKTSGVIGDDLALNAEQVTGFSADRELPVVFKVAVGSFINKLILIPSALLISSYAPFLITPMLFLGGSYLCFEGVEKVLEKYFHKKDTESNSSITVNEEEKIKGAIRTDFILSLEIVVIVLGTVAESPFMTRLLVLSILGVAMTIGVYGLVALIVKIDDLGLFLKKTKYKFFQMFGNFLLILAPILMKVLTIAGTIAMFLVGGGIITHTIPPIHHFTQNYQGLISLLLDGITGIISGFVFVGLFTIIQKIRSKGNPQKHP